jgi:hypothetical protein
VELVRIRTLDGAVYLTFSQTNIAPPCGLQPVIFTMLLKLRASYELLGHTEVHVDGHCAWQPVKSDVRVCGRFCSKSAFGGGPVVLPTIPGGRVCIHMNNKFHFSPTRNVKVPSRSIGIGASSLLFIEKILLLEHHYKLQFGRFTGVASVKKTSVLLNSTGTGAPDHGARGAHEDLQVEPGRPRRSVLQI